MGLGAGWGSVRSSSLIPGLLANIGIPGMMLVVWFGLRIWGGVRRARRIAARTDRQRLLVIDATSGALAGTLAAAVVSAPTISNVDFYLVLGLLVGSIAQVERVAAARPRLVAAPA